MSNMRVRPENFEKAVKELVAKYGEDALDITTQATKTAARQTVSDLKSQSPVGNTGKYAKGWSHKAEKAGLTAYAETVYNRTDYQLTHLLEKPHATGKGGHYPSPSGGKDHTGIISKIEEEHSQKYIEEVMSKL